MRIVRYRYKNKIYWGIIRGGIIQTLKQSPFAPVALNPRGAIKLGKVTILAPAAPGKIVLAGLNYKDHARELKMKIPKEPVIFLKPPTAVIADKDDIIYPQGIRRLDYEAELAVVIKQKAKNIPEKAVAKHILGYTCLNDVTARDLQKKDGQWTRAKSFDTFCPIGPWIETDISPKNLKIICRVNGQIRQNSSTRELIFSIPRLVSFISRIMTLMPQDVISTGTPRGVGSVKPGDWVEVEIEGIGKLRNKVVQENRRG